MIIAIGADHAGRPLLERVGEELRSRGHEPLLVGPDGSNAADDYPDVARAIGTAILDGLAARGIALCGSGAGVSVAASKMHGIRGAVAHDAYTAHQMVEHDDVNVLCIGARVIGSELAAEVVAAYAGAQFSGEERHRRRLAKIAEIESAGR